MLLFLYSRRYQTVILSSSYYGLFCFLILEYLFNKRQPRVILLEFIRGEAPNNIIKKWIHPFLLRAFIAPIFRKTIKYFHVLSAGEQERYSFLYRMPRSHFVFIPWPLRLKADEIPERCRGIADSRATVITSGRAACDFKTIFKAAEYQSWTLVIICGKRDHLEVRKLNKNNAAAVFCEIPLSQHRQFVKDAAVYVLSLHETGHSAGHVRLRECVRLGVPVVATDVSSLKDYIIQNETGVLVPPGDYVAMRKAVNNILANRKEGMRLAKNAFDRAGDFLREDYLQRIRWLVIS